MAKTAPVAAILSGMYPRSACRTCSQAAVSTTAATVSQLANRATSQPRCSSAFTVHRTARHATVSASAARHGWAARAGNSAHTATPANASAAQRFLLHDPPDLRQLGEIVGAIAHDNRRAAAIITRFGTVLTKGGARWTSVAINDVVRSVIDVMRTDIMTRGVSLSARLDDDLPRVSGDVFNLQQVVMNLIINACDAMESSGAPERRLHLRTETNGHGSVRVVVSDNGPGVLEEVRERIFEPFVTSKPHRLGLGLAICRSIVSAHSGELWVEQNPRGGAAFCFSLPAAAEERKDVAATTMAHE